jgi:hypothetical protein
MCLPQSKIVPLTPVDLLHTAAHMEYSLVGNCIPSVQGLHRIISRVQNQYQQVTLMRINCGYRYRTEPSDDTFSPDTHQDISVTIYYGMLYFTAIMVTTVTTFETIQRPNCIFVTKHHITLKDTLKCALLSPVRWSL